MANTHTTLTELFTDIADAIKEKNGKIEPIVADTFPTEIENLKTGFDYINSDVTEIPDYAFYGCDDLKSFDCYNVTSIGANAFENCTRLKSVTLYGNIQSIGENAFQGCSNLKEIYVAWAENERDGAPWGADNAIIYYSSVGSDGLEYTLKSDNTYEISATNSTDTDIIIPKYYNGLPVTSIGDKVFKNNTSITFVVIPDGVTYIGTQAFYNCTSLTSVVIPNTILMLKSNAFYRCSKLVYYEYDNGYYLGNENNPYVVFVKVKNKDITSCIIHENTKIICYNAFSIIINNMQYGCKQLATINIPQSVIQIGSEAFEYCYNLISITMPNSITSIDSLAFSQCKSLTSITYAGTISQWNSIIFSDYWNSNTGNYIIHCTDGDIAKDGTITYH